MFEVISLGGIKTVATKSACNHVYVVDVSGSMYNDLPKVRQHMKNIVTMVAQPDDTFSVIYFSGKGQCGVVFENVLVSDASTIQSMHTAIDRFIKPIGLTGFVDPMKLAMGLNLDSSKLNNFVFMTDGGENQSSKETVMEQVKQLPSKFQSISFLEYGYYADRAFIAKMAEEVGGIHIFAEGYNKYEEALESAFSAVARVNNIEVKVNKAAKHCIYVYNGKIRIAPVVDGVVSVPEDTDKVHSIVPKDVLSKQLSEDHLYLIMYYAAKQDNSELVWNVLQVLGDVALINKYSNAFTKQELSDFEDMVEAAVLDESKRFVEGKDTSLVPSKNAPTVVGLLQLLAASSAKLVLDSPYWNYKSIGRGRKAENELPRFVKSPMGLLNMNNLAFSSERPNVSISSSVNGVVELPENEFGLKKVPSFITRNYTIVKDGILNVDTIPVVIPKQEFDENIQQFSHEVIEDNGDSLYVVFNLRKIPVINRSMVENVTLGDFARKVAALNEYKASLKVLSGLIEENGGTTAKITGLVNEYGEDAAKWLSSIGVRDYGFSPVGTTSEEATDEYESIQVISKIKGLSSLPALKAVRDKVKENKKLNLGDTLINKYIGAFNSLSKEELEALKESNTKLKRNMETAIAFDVYSLVLGRKWFGEDEVIRTTINIGDNEADMTVEKTRKMIKF